MFCSKCGKTLTPDTNICPHCKKQIGDVQFVGDSFTSAQTIIVPGDTVQFTRPAYTRTTYMAQPDEEYAGTEGADTATTYRPEYSERTLPDNYEREAERIERQQREQEQAKKVELDEEESAQVFESLVQEGFDASKVQINIPRETAAPKPGISPEVEETMERMYQERQRKEERAKNGVKFSLPFFQKQEEKFDEEQREPEEGEERVYDPNEGEQDAAPEGAGETQGEPAEDSGDFVDGVRRSLQDIHIAGLGFKQLLQIAGGIVLLACLIFGGVKWYQYVSDRQQAAPIENVTLDVYNEGLELIQAHSQSEYINKMLDMYKNEGVIAFTTTLQKDAEDIEALATADAMVNDAAFIDALSAIQDNIANALTLDALAETSSDNAADAVAQSQERWKVIANAVAALQAAKTPSELSAIINGDKITVVTNTPEPTAAPYTVLTKGMSGDDVLNLQKRLYALGYLDGDLDGAFGTKTQTAIKYFQQGMQMNVTGIADEETQAVLYSDQALTFEDARDAYYARQNGSTVEATQAPEATVEPSTSPSVLALDPTAEPTQAAAQQ